MSKKDFFVIVLKVIVYAAGLFLGYLGVSSLASCTVQKSAQSVGRAQIVTVDTTVIEHSGVLEFHPLKK